MPYLRIETRGDWLRPRADELFAGIDAALVRVLQVPPDDALIRLICHDPALIRLPRGADPAAVFIDVALFPGRPPETKRRLYRELCAALAALDVPAARITIALHEIGLGDWGIGGVPASELHFAFLAGPAGAP